jgi:hypothetical protein
MRWTTFPRRLWILCLALSLLLGLLPVIQAQTAAVPLTSDTPVTGTLDADNIAQVYVFTAATPDTVSLTAVSDSLLALLLTDETGAIIAQIASAEGGATLETVLPDAGVYFVTVFRAPAETAADAAAYELTLTLAGGGETAATPVPTEATATSNAPITYTLPQEILIQSGMEVRLEWTAQVDLNLEVRDPFGFPLFWDSRSTDIGGNFGFDANGLCERIAEVPVETATWTPGFLPTGSYEILVFYRQSCVTPNPTVPFTITTTVNGTVLNVINGSLTAPLQGQDSVYVANFVVNADGTATINQGGVYPDTSLRVLPADGQALISAAQPIQRDTPTTGAIVGAQPYQTYSFEAAANEVVSISLNRVSGGLDTLLQVIDSAGNLVEVSDDAAGSTNSALTNLRLVSAGTYTIVATRYGKEIGGTEGEFELLLTGASGQLPAEVANLNLPQGAIGISLVWNTSADLQLLVRDPVGDAVFDDEPQVNSGGILAAQGNVNCVRAEGTPVSYIYWPNGLLRPGTYEIEVWFQSTCNDTTPVDFTLTTLVNNEVVITERQRPQADQRFVVSFTVSNDNTAERGEGGFISNSSTTIPYREESPIIAATIGQPASGQITPDNYFDVYVFDGTIGQTVTISMNATSQTLDPKLFLIAPSGAEAAQNDDAEAGVNKNSLIQNYELEEDGQYVIIATRYALSFGGTVGSYTVLVR